MSSTVVNNGMCRCCASEGTFKDVKTAYNWMGAEEIYYNMLQDCFDITLTSVDESDNGGICEVCITQLRNAANFKKQVQHTEEQFKLRLEGKFFKNNEVKIEVDKDSLIEFGRDSDDNDSDNDNDNTEVLFAEGYEIPIKTESEEKEKETKSKKRATRASTSKAKKAKTDDGESSSIQNQDLTCHICDREFTKTFNLKRHLRTKHKKDTSATTRKLCEGCGKVFYNEDYLAKHLALGCLSKARICVKCDKAFDNKSDMFKHMRTMHWCGSKLSRFNCPLCDEVLDCHENHDLHLSSQHGVELDYQEMTFKCLDDLKQWKENIERKDGICFPKRSSCLGFYYHCFPTRYITSNRIRGKPYTCPARIEFIEQGGRILASYQSRHLCEKSSMRKKDKTRVFCPICAVELDSYEGLNGHLMEHNIDVVVENWSFRSNDGTDGAPRKRKKKRSDASATPERVEHRVNLTSILQNSNATPFRDKTMRGFSCLYCAQSFTTIDDLRLHTAVKAEKAKLNTMKDYKLSYNPIKVDITDLKCTICDEDMKDLNDLKDHLIAVHNKTIYKDIKDIILPFRLENGQNYTCVICSVVHVSFKNLYHHMSSHYTNYFCNKCGVGYITIAALRKHGKTHYQGNFPCDFCHKIYTSMVKKRNHEKGVHTGGWLRNKCPYCTEIFVSYYDRNEHLVKMHNGEPLVFACNACDKTYKKKFELNRHIKHHHLQQKSYICDKCNAKFFSKRGLADHMARHYGVQMSTCNICGKQFSRERTLTEHVTKVHGDFKKYQCHVCEKNFMQKFSLKNHMRLHQDDLDIFKEFDDVKHLIDNRELTLKQIAAENKKKEMAEKMKTQHYVEIEVYRDSSDQEK